MTIKDYITTTSNIDLKSRTIVITVMRGYTITVIEERENLLNRFKNERMNKCWIYLLERMKFSKYITKS